MTMMVMMHDPVRCEAGSDPASITFRDAKGNRVVIFVQTNDCAAVLAETWDRWHRTREAAE